MSKLKQLYEDLKPDEKFGEIALEALRRAPLASAKTVIATLLDAKFNMNKAMETLNTFLEIILKSEFYGDILVHEGPSVERAIALKIDWEHVMKEKSLFPKNVENLWVYDAEEDITHHKKILQYLKGRFGNDPRKIVEQIIRKCDVFKIREDLYVFCILLLGVGWKIFVAKTGKLVKPPKITTIEKNMWEWGVWPYYLAFSRGCSEVPEVGIKLPKVNCGVLKTKCKLPSELLIADSFTKNLIAEKRDEKILLCTMTLEAGWETAEYIKTIREDKTVKTIFWWDAPQIWEWWYGLEKKPDLEKEYFKMLSRYSDFVKISEASIKYESRFFEVLVPGWRDALKIKNKEDKIKAAIKTCSNVDWAPKVKTHSHVIIKSDGFDAESFLNIYLRINERKKWLNMLDETSKKYMLKENLRKEYTIILENKI